MAFCALLLLVLLCAPATLADVQTPHLLLTPSDRADGDLFGASTAIAHVNSRYVIAVGAMGKTVEQRAGQGAVYVYECASATSCVKPWRVDFSNSDGENAHFGQSVALSSNGAVLYAGAPGYAGHGALVIFSCAASSSCTATQTLSPASLGEFDLFGASVSAHGRLVVVGAPFARDDAGDAYVYWCTGASSCSAPLRLSQPPGAVAEGAFFGYAVAVSGTLIAVGAPGAGNGTVFLYNCAAEGVCAFGLALTDPQGIVGDRFGQAVALEGGVLAVGTLAGPTRRGAVLLFDCDATIACAPGARVVPDGAADDDQFGEAVALSGVTLVVGAPWRALSTGGVYIFSCSTAAACAQVARVEQSAPVQGDFWGTAVAASGAVVVAGAREKDLDDDAHAGAAYLSCYGSACTSDCAPGYTFFGGRCTQCSGETGVVCAGAAAPSPAGTAAVLSVAIGLLYAARA